ncbi:PAC2 family protein [bacterium]|nr:PAC2 family protein [bacterium]
MLKDWLKLNQLPKLNNPVLIAAWPGMGKVAFTAVAYYKKQLHAQVLGDIKGPEFFAPTGSVVRKQVVRAPEPAENRLYVYQSKDSGRDVVFFLGSVQPVPHMEYIFAHRIIDVAEKLGVSRIYTTAAAPSDMQLKDTPRVFAVPNNSDILKELLNHEVYFMGDGSIAGMNGLLVSVARERDMDGICLLGEIPFFTVQIEYPKASLQIIQVLSKMLGHSIDFVDLEMYAEEKQKDIEPLAHLLSRERAEPDTHDMGSSMISPHEEKVPKSVKARIEKLFRQAESDRAYKSKMRLKEELDNWGVFQDYEDRFLDLFKKSQGDS